MTLPRWTFQAIAVAAVTAVLVSRADAQLKIDPKVDPKTNPKTHPPAHPPAHPPVYPVIGLPKAPSIVVHPQLNSFPGLPAAPFFQPAVNPGPYSNPALYNPWMNQTRIIPTNPYASNPIGPTIYIANPYASTFMSHPPFTNPFASPFANPYASPFANPFAPTSFSTPPIAIQQPGYLVYRGPDLQVNPWSGLVYRPQTGIARTADGSVFYHVPGTGLPTVTGDYAAGSGLYFDPQHGTFLNPTTGVISKPGVTNVFVPWIR